MNNEDISKLMNMLSKMDKKDLESGLAKAGKMLNIKDTDAILREIRKNSK